MTAHQSLDTGLVVAGHGRHFVVESPEGERRICHPRGKKSEAVVGDNVLWMPSGDEGTIERIEPRRNLFYRRDEMRTKAFAANLDQVLILLAAQPDFSEHQLARALIAAEAERLTPIIALNKSDLADEFERAWKRLVPYRRMHYGVLPLSLKFSREVDRAHLMNQLRGRTTLVLGPSGTGKSTLVNLLVPDARAQTGEISTALNSGRHTTTSTTWYWIDMAENTALIDSPGFQEFGLRHLEPAQLAVCMPDIRANVEHCRFYNCTHLHEPGCAVIAAVEGNGPPGDPAVGHEPASINARRYAIYRELHAELSQSRY